MEGLKRCGGPLHKGAMVEVYKFPSKTRHCRECKNFYYKNRTPEAAQRAKEQSKNWMRNFREKISPQELKTYYRNAETKHHEKLENKVWSRLRHRCHAALKGLPMLVGSYEELIGCNKAQYMEYIRPLMTRGMHKGNYGKDRLHWQIDHIVSLCNFDMSTKEGQLAAFHYTNTQPLWAHQNWTKRRKPLGVLGSAGAVEIPLLKDGAGGGMPKPLLDDIDRDLEFDYTPSGKSVA